MIELTYTNGKALVWNLQAVDDLRKEHRIVGALTGSYPKRPFVMNNQWFPKQLMPEQTKLLTEKAVDDVRKEHRIAGAVVGSYPKKPSGMHKPWLPLQLMPEETKLLIEKGVARLVRLPPLPHGEERKAFYEDQKRLRREQVQVMMENRKRTILENADLIFEGKKRKLLGLGGGKRKSKKSKRFNSPKDVPKEMETSEIQESASMSEATGDSSSISKATGESSSISEATGESSSISEATGESSSISEATGESSSIPEATGESSISMEKDVEGNIIIIDKEAIIQKELDRWSDVRKYKVPVPLYIECPFKKNKILEEVSFEYPRTEEEKVRFAVFKDLWEKGLYITSGCKFGGDFLAYEGDPSKCHASFIVKCIAQTAKFQATDIVIYGRLGNQVKKTFALASVNSLGIVEYITFKWAPEMKG